MSMNEPQKEQQGPLLLGSTFPLALIRRRVMVEPVGLNTLRKELKGRDMASFWGHDNTCALARELLSRDVAPKNDRPALHLSEDGYPMLDGRIFQECWVLSPEYQPGFRPAIGGEVSADKIRGWQVLRMTWKPITKALTT